MGAMGCKRLFVSFLMFLSFQALAQATDPCTGSDVVPNEWLVVVNYENGSDKVGILDTLEVFTSIGFSGRLLSARGGEQGYFIYHLVFDASNIPDQSKAEAIKNDGLRKIKEIPGNAMECNRWAEPNLQL
jgi:hypothetical protein